MYVISTSVYWGEGAKARQTAVESGRRSFGRREGRQALSSSSVETGEQGSTASRGRGGVKVETGQSGKVRERRHLQRV